MESEPFYELIPNPTDTVENFGGINLLDVPSIANILVESDPETDLPEILIGLNVFGYDRETRGIVARWRGTYGKGGILHPLPDGSFAGAARSGVVLDVDMDGAPEVVTANTIYEGNGAVAVSRDYAYLRNVAGKTAAAASVEAVADGHVSPANLDGDAFPELVSTYNTFFFGLLGAWDYNGRVQVTDSNLRPKWDLPQAFDRAVGIGTGLGGGSTIGRFGGAPGFAFGNATAASLLGVRGTDLARIWSAPHRDTSSTRNGMTCFDFDGDGRMEVVQLDEVGLRVLDGETGTPRASIRNLSLTGWEYATIADVDGDGQAEIVVPANLDRGGNRPDAEGPIDPFNGLRVFGGLQRNWAPSPPIWNQYDYSIDNVNPDGTIPPRPKRSWLTHNTFRSNGYPTDTPALPTLDLTAARLVVSQHADEETGEIVVNVAALVGNAGARTLPAGGSRVAFYYRPAELGGEAATAAERLLGVIALPSLETGAAAELFESFPTPMAGRFKITAFVNDTGELPECDFENNRVSVEAELLSSDEVGPDLCPVTLAPNPAPAPRSVVLVSAMANDDFSIDPTSIEVRLNGVPLPAGDVSASALEAGPNPPLAIGASFAAPEFATTAVEVVASDHAGNEAACEAILTVTGGTSDTLAPTAMLLAVPAILTPSEDEIATATLHVTAADFGLAGLASVRLYAGAGDLHGMELFVAGSDDPFEPFAREVVRSFPCGTQTGAVAFRVVARDRAGNSAEAIAPVFVVDEAPPAVHFHYGGEELENGEFAPIFNIDDMGFVGAGIPIEVTVSDCAGLTTTLNPSRLAIYRNAETSPRGLPVNFRDRVLTEFSPAALSEGIPADALGTYRIDVTSHDRAGNEVVFVAYVNVTGDLYKPSVAVGTIEALGCNGPGGLLRVGVSASDNQQLARVELAVFDSCSGPGTGCEGREVVAGFDEPPDTRSATHEFLWSPGIGDGGLRYFELRAIDAAGNVATKVFSATVGTTPCADAGAIRIFRATPDPLVAGTPVPFFFVTTEPPATVAAVVRHVETNAKFAASVNPTNRTISFTPAARGHYEVLASAGEPVVGRASEIVRVFAPGDDWVPPTLTVSAGADVPGPNFYPITIHASDAGGLVRVSTTINGVPFGAPTTYVPPATGAETIILQPPLACAGTDEIEVTARDAAGNETVVSAIKEFSGTAPVASPVVAFTSPEPWSAAPGAVRGVVTKPTEIFAVVSDGYGGACANGLLSWRLELLTQPDAQGYSEVARVLATGSQTFSAPGGGPVGTFDPSLLKNGLHTLRLVATNRGGQTAETTLSLMVLGDFKVGHFTVGFVDLSVPIHGVPLVVTRSAPG